jgi:hypothetical protein
MKYSIIKREFKKNYNSEMLSILDFLQKDCVFINKNIIVKTERLLKLRLVIRTNKYLNTIGANSLQFLKLNFNIL